MTAAYGEIMESVNPQQPLVGLTGNRRRNNPVPATATHENVPVILLQDLRKSSSAVDRVRHSRLLMSDRQPLRPAPTLPAREPPPDFLKQHVLAVPIRQRRLVQDDAPVAVPAEGRQGEGVVVSQGAEDEASGHDPSLSVSSDAGRAHR